MSESSNRNDSTVAWRSGLGWSTPRPQFETEGGDLIQQTLTQTFKTARISANSLVLYAKKNPSVQRLVSNYEEWESNLRKEAETRLGGFKPLQQLLDANAEERVPSNKLGQALPWGGGLKRSASEGSLTNGSEPGTYHRKPRGQRVHLRQDWDVFTSFNPASNQGRPPPGWGVADGTDEAEAAGAAPGDAPPSSTGAEPGPSSGSAGGSPSSSAVPARHGALRFPRATTAPALRDAAAVQQQQQRPAPDEGASPSDSPGSTGGEWMPPLGSRPTRGGWQAGGADHHHHHHHASAGSLASSGSSQGEEPAANQPPLAGSSLSFSDSFAAFDGALLDPDGAAAQLEAARQLEAAAARLLAQSRLAILSAQQSLAETASNCQQNLQTLGQLFQSSVQPLAGVGGADAVARRSSSDGASSAGGGALQVVPWRPGSREPLAPWDLLLPRYLRARGGGADDPSGSTGGSGGGDDSDAGGLGGRFPGGAAALYNQLTEYFERLEVGRRRGAGAPHLRSLREEGRRVAIVTTASLPWMTGTAVNPLLRAAYLSSDGSRRVTLMLPWLSRRDQEVVFPGAVTFDSPLDQEAFVREWAQKRTGLACNFAVKFYPGRYAPEKGSILPVGDITQYIPDSEADVAVLEEPEHLSWYHHGTRWTDKFAHVVGVMHTNYLDYARREEGGAIKEALLKHINAWVCRVNCHKVVKLSDAVQPLPREITQFVHGVSPGFLQVGRAKAEQAADPATPPFPKGAYFLGKVLWAKGYTELLDRLGEHANATGENVTVDVYGSGPDFDAVVEEAGKRRLNLRFNGPRDHADSALHDYKVFINPSLSDVVATTTAEALAMGKWVVCADHPSNRFFSQFPNCLVYNSPDEFSRCLERAMAQEPAPLSGHQLQSLTWEAATERFLDVAEIDAPAPPHEQLLDNCLAAAHNTLTGLESLRIVMGAGANTRDTPPSVTDYSPTDSDVGGLFDDASRAKRTYAKAAAKAALAGDRPSGVSGAGAGGRVPGAAPAGDVMNGGYRCGAAAGVAAAFAAAPLVAVDRAAGGTKQL